MKEFKTLGYDWECGHEDLIIRVLSYLLIVKMRPLEENRHQKWESRSVMALCQYRMA